MMGKQHQRKVFPHGPTVTLSLQRTHVAPRVAQGLWDLRRKEINLPVVFGRKAADHGLQSDPSLITN